MNPIKTRSRSTGGFALLAALLLMSLLAIVAIAVLSRSGADRRRASRHLRAETRENCAYAGLTYARAYFANNFNDWDVFFARPDIYNPMDLPTTTSGWGSAPANAPAEVKTTAGRAAIKATNAGPIVGSRLFVDLDADGLDDVYVSIRDNLDEMPPAAPNYKRDNDQNAIVGATCISTTMTPRRDDGSLDADQLTVESYLSVNDPGGAYTGQSGGGATQTGSLN